MNTKIKRIMHEVQIAEILDVPYNQFFHTIQDPNRYNTFNIGKKARGFRQIYAPNDELKLIQKRLQIVLENQFPVHRQAHGFVKGKDFITNAQLHLQKNQIFTFDIENFFPSISRKVVNILFREKLNFANRTAAILTDIVCHPAGFLPQGAPTSPIISNLILKDFDIEMEQLAKKYCCTYSRYADDITFSTNDDVFPNAIAVEFSSKQHQVAEKIQLYLSYYGLKVHPKKVHLQRPNHKKIVTGIVVNEKLNVDRKYMKIIRAALFNLKNKAEYKQEVCKIIGQPEDYSRYIDKNEIILAFQTLRGKIEHIGNVRGKEDTYYTQLKKECLKVFRIYKYRKII